MNQRFAVSGEPLQIDRVRFNSQNLFSVAHREAGIQTHIGSNIDADGRSSKILKKNRNLVGFVI
jgi:hypothetical protein